MVINPVHEIFQSGQKRHHILELASMRSASKVFFQGESISLSHRYERGVLYWIFSGSLVTAQICCLGMLLHKEMMSGPVLFTSLTYIKCIVTKQRFLCFRGHWGLRSLGPWSHHDGMSVPSQQMWLQLTFSNKLAAGAHPAPSGRDQTDNTGNWVASLPLGQLTTFSRVQMH